MEEVDDENDEAPIRSKQPGMTLTIIGEDEEPAFASVLEPSNQNEDLFNFSGVNSQNLPSNQQIEPDQNSS